MVCGALHLVCDWIRIYSPHESVKEQRDEQQKMPIKISMVINFLTRKRSELFPSYLLTRLLIHEFNAPYSTDFGKKPIVFFAPHPLSESRLRRIQSIEQVAQFGMVMHVITNEQRTHATKANILIKLQANSTELRTYNRTCHREPAANSRHRQMNLKITFKFEKLVLHFISCRLFSFGRLVLFVDSCAWLQNRSI